MAFVVAYKSRIITTVRVMPSENMYRTSAIISRGLYIFYPIFHCGLYCRAVSIADNLCTKQGNSSMNSMVYNQERVIMGRVLRKVVIEEWLAVSSS